MTDALQFRAVADLGGGPAADAVPDDGPKACLSGTHRAVTPEETLRRIEPLYPVFGITRLADVTWLDEIGIPVYQAVRPRVDIGQDGIVVQFHGRNPFRCHISAIFSPRRPGRIGNRIAPGRSTSHGAQSVKEFMR